MHHHSTKQRLAALRRRLGIHLTPATPREARRTLHEDAVAAVRAAHDEATAALRAAKEASRRIVAALTPAPGVDLTPAPLRQIVAALTPAPGVELTPAPLLATAGGAETPHDAPTTVAQAPYPSQHLSATDAARARTGGGGGGSGTGGSGGSKRWVVIVLLVLVALGLAAWCGLSKKEAPVAAAPAPAPAQAVAPAPPPPPPPAPPPPPPAAPKRLTVVKGDCLWRLSGAHLGDPQAWRRLFDANRGAIRNPDLIYPGQTLELP